ncbi:ABC-F family ATP-binding cassette domain-containing protein [Mucilaginibacter gynuensis]|uniref:ABC-F family ATP-binding cassette domain-containing protein n=1 Tax=Mucilaginibacter gynuensis TaxID=1302236 RepID=A0ABP8GFX5_9SPHI
MSIIINSVSFIHPDKETLFRQLTLSISKGDKASLVGNNGAGKSTLLQVIAGKLRPSSGEIILTEKPWFVPQHLGQYNECTIAEVLEVAIKLKAIDAITSGDPDLSLYDQLEDDWTIADKVSAALSEWGIGHLLPGQLMRELSGGEKTKVFLAGISIWEPGIILLDEPTNHLDSAGREKVYKLMVTSKATILLVSHDRLLLNLVNKTIELNSSGLEVYGGNFDFFKEQQQIKADALQNQLDDRSKVLKQTQHKARELAEQRQKKEIRGKAAGQTNSLPRIIAGGLKSKAEQSTTRVLDRQHDKAEGITEQIRQLRSQIQQYQVLQIDISSSSVHRGKLLVDARRINFRYGEKWLWEPLNFQIRSGDRVQISGDNGKGKTTLIGLITGKLTATSGILQRVNFKYLYLDQDYTLIRVELTVYEQVSYYNSRNLEEHELKSLLIYSQFPREAWDRKSKDLSGGEKMKLSLCCLAVSNYTPDMLILDEPTNNLDVQSLDILTASIKTYNGTLVVVSHDRQFVADIGISQSISLNTKS